LRCPVQLRLLSLSIVAVLLSFHCHVAHPDLHSFPTRRSSDLLGGAAKRISVSEVDRLDDASLSYASLSGWKDLGVLDEFLRLCESMWRTRGYGDFYSYMLLAEGAVDLACEPELALYDMGALVPIVTEAGGAFTNTAGVPGPFGGNAVASNSRLQDAV